jgi:hypothetical protein
MRTLEEINKEYSQAAAELGVLTYEQERAIPFKISLLKDKIQALHQEADAVKKEEK